MTKPMVMESIITQMGPVILDNGSRMSKKAMAFKKKLMALYIMGILSKGKNMDSANRSCQMVPFMRESI